MAGTQKHCKYHGLLSVHHKTAGANVQKIRKGKPNGLNSRGGDRVKVNLKLNETVLKKYCEDVTKKQVPATEEPEVVTEFLKYIQMQNEFMKTASAYEISSILRSFSTWFDNKDSEPKSSFASQREVHYIDLGGFNLKYEEGYIHPCLVIKRYRNSVIVIPGSTKKFGLSNDLIFDIHAGNGFKEDTGLLLDQIRCVSTTRLISKLRYGKVSTEVFSDVMDKFMEKFLSKQFHDFTQLKIQNTKLQKQLEQSEINAEALKQENEELKKQVEEYKITKIKEDA